MLKLAILIKPNFKIKNLCFLTKKKFKIKYGKQKYLDHFPHVTILTINVKNNFINNIDEIVKEIKIYKKIPINFSSFNYFPKDPITGLNTIYLKVNKNKKLKLLQNNILKLLNKYKSNNNLDKNKFNFNSTQFKNLIKFGYPFVNKEFHPHLTICSLENKYFKDIFIQKYFKKKIYFKDVIKNIFIYEIKNEKHHLIKKINFNE